MASPTYMTVRFSSNADCFARLNGTAQKALPPEPVQTSYGPSGSVLLLQWGSYSQFKCHVSEVPGGVTGVREGESQDKTTNVLFLPVVMASMYGISEGALVQVSRVWPVAKPVAECTIEPVSADDYERLELNAEVVEMHMLDQINVLNEHTPFPFFISPSNVVRMQLTHQGGDGSARSHTPKGYLRVWRDTKLTVIPKYRAKEDKKDSGKRGSAEQSMDAEARLALRVQPWPTQPQSREHAGFVEGVDASACESANASGEARGNAYRRESATRVLFVHQSTLKQLQLSENAMVLLTDKPSNTVVDVCSVAIGGRVLRGHVQMHPLLRRAHGINLFDRVGICAAKHQSLPTHAHTHASKGRVLLTQLRRHPLSPAPLSPSELLNAFTRWLHCDALNAQPLTQNCCIRVHQDVHVRVSLSDSAASAKNSLPFSFSFSEQAPYTELVEASTDQGQDPADAKTRAPVDGKKYQVTVGAAEALDGGDGASGVDDGVWARVLQALGFPVPHADAPAHTRTHTYAVGALSHVYTRTMAALWANVCTDQQPRKQNWQGVLVSGASGTGKTSLLACMAHALIHNSVGLSEGGVYVEAVSCGALRTLKRQEVMTALRTALVRCIDRQPAVLLVDDLDLLLPPMADGGGGGGGSMQGGPGTFLRVTQLAHWLHDYMLSLKHTFPHARVCICASATNKQQSVHSAAQALFTAHTHIDMSAVDTGRSDVLACILKHHYPLDMLRLDTSTFDAERFQRETEGFCGRDIANLVTQTIQAQLQLGGADTAEDALSLTLGTQLLMEHTASFTPLSLRGVPTTKVSLSLADVGGYADVINVLRQTFELPFKHPQLFKQIPIKLRSGILLFGPPGCGKTHLAQAIAASSGLTLLSVKGPELLDKYIGSSEAKVREVFERASSVAPSIVFFDEFEAIAPKRGGDRSGVTDRVVNQFLCQLDGVESRSGVFVLAASSRPDLIDPALLRPGRLDKSVYVGFPDEQERVEVLRACCRQLVPRVEGGKEKGEEGKDSVPRTYTQEWERAFAQVAAATQDYSCADLQAIVSNAQLLFAHQRMRERKEQSSLADAQKSVFSPTFLAQALSTSAKTLNKSQLAFHRSIKESFGGFESAPEQTSVDKFDPAKPQTSILA